MADEVTARIDPLGAPKPISPTGAPLIPVAFVPFLVAVVAIAEGLAQFLPEYTVGARIAHAVAGLGLVFGLASPGLRKR